MSDKQDLIREIQEYVAAHGGEHTTTHLLVQAAAAIGEQAAELEAVGAGGVQSYVCGHRPPCSECATYAAPQPAVAAGCEQIAEAALRKVLAAPLSDDVVKDAARYRWLREGNDAKHGAAWHVAVNLYGCEWDAAIDAALSGG